MLLVDGVEYHLYRFSKEGELEDLIEANSKKIFGEDSLYFNVKTKLRSPAGIVSIPDGYVITLTKPYRWFVVEAELSSHPIYDHVVNQLGKFVNGLKKLETRKSLVKSLHDTIILDPVQDAWVRQRLGAGELYKFLNDLIDKPPELAVIIDEKTVELEEAIDLLPPLSEYHVIEFKVYEREGVGLRNILSFSPLRRDGEDLGESERTRSTVPTRKSHPKGSITSQSAYGIPILESLVEMGGKGKTRDVLARVLEKMKDSLTNADLETLPSGGDIRWSNRAMWERLNLVKKGYLKPKTQSGIWEITDEGRDYIKTKKNY